MNHSPGVIESDIRLLRSLLAQCRSLTIAQRYITQPGRHQSKFNHFISYFVLIQVAFLGAWWRGERSFDMLTYQYTTTLHPQLFLNNLVASTGNSKLLLPSFNPYSAKLHNLNFHPLKVVSRYRDPQLQVGENLSYLFNLRQNICNYCCLNTYFTPNNCYRFS